jgi:hypothetical protein
MRSLFAIALLVVFASATGLAEEADQPPSAAPAAPAPSSGAPLPPAPPPAPAPAPAIAAPPAAETAPQTTAVQPAPAGPQTQLGTPDAPLVVKPLLEPRPESEIASEEEDRTERRANGRLILVFNGVVASFTVILGISTILLWIELRKLRRLAGQQAKDTDEQLRLTRRSVETAIAFERPVFAVDNTSMSPHSRGATIELGNHGRTLAIVTQDCLVIGLAPALPDKPRYPISEVERISNSKSVDPGREYEIFRPIGPTDDEWGQALRADSVLWAYGYLEYIDFLKQRRRAGFCLAFVPTRPGVEPGTGKRDGIWVQSGPASYAYDEPVVYPDPAFSAAQSASEDEAFRKIEPALKGAEALKKVDGGGHGGG